MNARTEHHEGDEPFQGDLFACTVPGWPVKDDIASMELPVFSLSKKPDTEIREYRNGLVYIKIIPSALGCATVFDKDLLIYAGSQIIEARNRGKPISSTVVIDTADFLRRTERGDGRASFERVTDMLDRLNGTKLIKTEPNGQPDEVDTAPFSLIADYRITSKIVRKATVTGRHAGTTKQIDIIRPLSFQVVLSDWFYKSLLNFDVLTLDRSYFLLSSSIERRLYEIGRKFCGDKPIWKINITSLSDKIGCRQDLRFFRRDLREIIKKDTIPDYHVAIEQKAKSNQVVFYTRDVAKLAQALMKKKDMQGWFSGLERYDSRLAQK
jgi:plasmid replication initiation protein